MAPKTTANKQGSEIDISSINREVTSPPVRITLASSDEYNILLQNGLDFYGATFFPTADALPYDSIVKVAIKKGR